MARLILIILLSFPVGLYAAIPARWFTDADLFLKTVVTNGTVDYAAIRKDPSVLNKLVSMAGEIKPDAQDNINTQKAFYINSFNLWMIKKIVDYKPVTSVLKIENFLNSKNVRIAGSVISINELQSEIIPLKFKDPRIHFALCTASFSSPKIKSGAYMPLIIDKQLDEACRNAMNDQRIVREDAATKTIFISEIFNWFKKDFGNTNTAVNAFINKYRKTPLPKEWKTDFLPTIWALNTKTVIRD